jgi:cytochrome c553
MPRLISVSVAWRACAALIAAGLGVSLAYADIIVTEGMQPWHPCATCHSLDGISAMARFPKLAGQRAAYIVKQVRDFRDGRRNNDGGQMQASASDIDDGDLAKAASYFASLPPPPPDGSLETNGEEWRRGAKLYQDGDAPSGIASCGSCHDGAESKRPDAPLLKAQHAAYLAKQLSDWRSGERRNDLSQTMPGVAAKLSDRDISALATFLASQPRLRSNGAAAQ